MRWDKLQPETIGTGMLQKGAEAILTRIIKGDFSRFPVRVNDNWAAQFQSCFQRINSIVSVFLRRNI